MEVFELKNVVLMFVFVGVLLGIGILTLDSFQMAIRTSTSAVDTAKNLSSGSSVTLSKAQCTGVTQIDNGTTTFDLSTYNVTFSNKEKCILGYSAITACASPKCNITYTYGANSTSSVATSQAMNAIGDIPTTWMGLIVTVIALSIVLGLVIRSFSGGASRQ